MRNWKNHFITSCVPAWQAESYLDSVNTLPRVKRRENFLGLTMIRGKNEIASPKQIVPATKTRINYKIKALPDWLPNSKLVINPRIRCFFDKLGRLSSIFLASQLWFSFLLLALPPLLSLTTPRNGSSSSGPPSPPPPPKGVFRAGSLMEENLDVSDESELEELLLLR